MIEIKNLTKIYNKDQNNEVKALDHINFQLEETGMVFILGKSGSGKSTLLNMLGGLDAYDEGEMIIKGKSSKDFTQSEFDSYRNTFIGFVFQEYNLLNEFTVGKNIKIALELQGLKSDPETVESILEQVDLKGYSDRMPYELSTGQKQRVAIARVLVKSPDIILADEPTGALDSQTGKQVLDTLKQLSKEKLVIVITHDKEFAETYGDRIIEISDGKIINDSHEKLNIKTYTPDDFKLVQSKLPIVDAIKMGVSNLKLKPFRLILTILLSAVAFMLFGLADIMISYDQAETTINSLNESGIHYVLYAKEKNGVDSNGNRFYYDYKMKDEDLDYFEDQFPNHDFVPVYKQYQDSYQSSLYLNLDTVEKPGDGYYNRSINGSMELTDDLMNDLGLTLIAGEKPSNNNEIMITKYTYTNIAYYHYKDNKGEEVLLNNPEDILGKTIMLSESTFTITGVVDTHFNEERYQVLLGAQDSNLNIDMLRKERDMALDYGIHSLVYFKEGYFDELLNVDNKDSFTMYDSTGVELFLEDYQTTRPTGTRAYIKSVSKMNDLYPIHWKDGTERTQLSENEVLIPISAIPKYSDIEGVSTKSFNVLKEEYKDVLIREFANEHYNEIKDGFDNYYGYNSTVENYIEYIKNASDNQFHEGKTNYYFYIQASYEVMNDIYLPAFQDLTLFRFNYDDSVQRQISVVGYYDDGLEKNTPIIVSNELYQDLWQSRDGHYKEILTPFTKQLKEDVKLIEFSYTDHDGANYPIYNEVTSTLNVVNELLEKASEMILYVGLGLAGFASLMLFNFISVSITAKKREIGILRAIGARSKDVFMIFLSESLVIAFINFVLASIGTLILSNYINHSIRADYDLLLTLLSFGFRQIGLILLISILVALISSIIPVIRFARKKPIEVIKAV